jgi:lysophospholipase L1-like esterase
MRPPVRKALFSITTLAATLVGCSGTDIGPTINPPPSLTCPADVSAIARTSQPSPAVAFQAPAVVDGEPPVTVTCTPSSGSIFPIGTNRVSCEALDAQRRSARCTFSVIVSPAPRLTVTRFLAFGDSLTEGKSTLTGTGVVTVPDKVFNLPGSYPNRLDAKLTARYVDQNITVIADGRGSEPPSDAAIRLPGDLNFHSPDVLLLFTGINQILQTRDVALFPAATEDAVTALRTMIRYAKSRGVRVYVATMLPMGPAGRRQQEIDAVPVLNTRIRALATAEGATLVDLFAVVPVSMIGSDGLHPKADAYEVIAEEWFKAIRATLEAK